MKIHWWFELIVALLTRCPRIRFLDEWTHVLPKPVAVHSALSALDVRSRANVDNRSLLRSVWQDRCTRTRNFLPRCSSTSIGELYQLRLIRLPPAPHHLVKCCPVNSDTSSAAPLYIFFEHFTNSIFRLRPELGNVLTLQQSFVDGFPQMTHLLITRSNLRCPMTADVLVYCLEHLKARLTEHDVSEIHFSLLDPERPLHNLSSF